MCTTNTKKYAERAWPCGRAASGRVARRGVLKKYAPKTDSFHCCRMGFHHRRAVKYAPKPGENPAAGWGRRPLSGLQNQKKGAKKGRKKGLAGQNLRLSRSARFRRPECGGGVCGSGGCLVCILFAGSITEAAGAGLGVHFLPAELFFGVRLVYALFAELRPGSMHTFCKKPGAA